MICQSGHVCRKHEIYRSRLPFVLMFLGGGAVWIASVDSGAKSVRPSTQIATISDIVNYYAEQGTKWRFQERQNQSWKRVGDRYTFDEPLILRFACLVWLFRVMI